MTAIEQGPDRRQAFEAEALPHLDRLYAVARRLAPAGVDPEDLVQETVLRAYRTFDNYRPGTNCRAWLLTILHSVFVNRFRRWQREPEAQPPEELERRAGRDRPTEDWEGPLLAAAAAGTWGTGAEVEAALRNLPDEYREAMLLVDVEELTYEEAAGALGCPVGTVRSRLHRARRRLAGELAAYARQLGYSAGTRS
jgi:RNA polymerase sigma-70 factor (ECF subfamily)